MDEFNSPLQQKMEIYLFSCLTVYTILTHLSYRWNAEVSISIPSHSVVVETYFEYLCYVRMVLSYYLSFYTAHRLLLRLQYRYVQFCSFHYLQRKELYLSPIVRPLMLLNIDTSPNACIHTYTLLLDVYTSNSDTHSETSYNLRHREKFT